MSDKFDDLLGGMLGGSMPQREDPNDKIKRVVMQRRLKEAEGKIAALQASNANLIRKAQNNIDRSWNKALRKAADEIHSLSIGQIERLKEMRRIVRHRDDFGDDK